MIEKKRFISIRTKIYLAAVLMITMGSVLCSFGTFWVMHKDILEKTKMDYQIIVNNTLHSLETNVNDIIRCSELIVTDQDVISYLKDFYDRKQDYAYFLKQSNMHRVMKNLFAMNSEILNNISIIDRKGNIFSYNGTEQNFMKAQETVEMTWNGFYFENGNLYYTCSIIGKNENDKTGRLFIEIKKEKFLEALETINTPDLELLVTDGNGRNIAGIDKQKGWELVGSKKISGTDWLVTAKVSEYILEESLRKAAGMVFIVWLSVLVVSYLIYRPILKILTESLLAIAKEIRNFKTGNEKFSSSIRIPNDEVGIIAKEYQKMESRIRQLVRRLQKQKETEINLYMAQINPHFIYNTLYALICVAERKQETEIADKIKGVADILCLSLYSKPDSLHTVKEERECIEQYIDILRYKYGKGVKINWDMKPEIEEEMISVLLLYPLVENAVFHGLSQVEDKQITIRIDRLANELQILVADNGIGMTQEEIYKIYNRFEQWIGKIETEDFDIEVEKDHMGLFNLKMRLYFLYGESASLKIDSIKGKGTKVQISIKNIKKVQ